MTTQIANCGYSTLFTAGLFNVGPGEYSPSNPQASFLEQFHETSSSPRLFLPPSQHSLDRSTHLRIQIPSSADPKQRRQLRIVTPTSPIRGSLFSIGTMWLLNRRRRNVGGRSSAGGSAMQALSASRCEHIEAYNLSQAISQIRRCIFASPKPPPTTPLPLPPPSLRSDDDTKHDSDLTIVSTKQKQARLKVRLIHSDGKQTLTSVAHGDCPSSQFQCEGEAIPDSPSWDEWEY